MIELIISAITLITVVIIAFNANRQIKETKEFVEEKLPSLDDYVWQEENGEWKVDERIGKVIDFGGSRLAHSLRQSMFQQMGVDAKLQKGVDKALSFDLLDNSGIGGILDLLGMSNTKKILANNPKTLGLILQRVAPMLKNINFGGQNRNDGSNIPSM